MSPRRLTPVAIVCWLGVASSVAAQDARLVRLEPAARPGVEAALDSARADGLPTEPLVDKALEGTVKHAPPERVVLAVRALRLRLLEARRVLGHEAEAPELLAGATALGAGVPVPTLTALHNRRPGATIILPLTVLSDLISRGVSVETAGTSLEQVLDADPRNDSRLRDFSERVRQDIAAGVVPDRSAVERARGVVSPAAKP